MAAPVLMPWVGFGTYRLGANQAKQAVLSALDAGYRMVDTAYIYSGEKTEPEVGRALASAMAAGVVRRDEVFVTTKHWRKFHGFEPALGCLERSLKRLQLEYVDCWMMHWPGHPTPKLMPYRWLCHCRVYFLCFSICPSLPR